MPIRRIRQCKIAIPQSDNTEEYWNGMIASVKDPKITKESDLTWKLAKGALKSSESLEDFQVTSSEYMYRNYPNPNHTFVFLPKYMLQIEHTKKLVDRIEYLFSTKHKSKRRVALVSCNLKCHLNMVGETASSIKFQHGSEDSIVLFIEELALIVIIRTFDDAQGNIGDKIEMCQEDIKSFVKLHAERIKEKFDVRIAGVIVCPDVNRKDLQKLLPFHFSDYQDTFYQQLFLCKEQIDSDEKFSKWLDNFWYEFRLKFDMKKNVTKCNEMFQKIIAHHMACMVSVQDGLPSLSNDTENQLQTVLLNPDQLTAIYSPVKKKLITGGFGSGKSLTGEQILRKLVTKLNNEKKPATVYYISGDQYSLIDCHVESLISWFLEDIGNQSTIKFVSNSFHQLYMENFHKLVDNLPIEKLLRALLKKDPNSHFILDEVPCSIVSKEEEATSLNEFLSTEAKEAHVVILEQSVEKDLKILREGDVVQDWRSNFLKEVKCFQGESCFHLSKGMRLAVENQELVNSAQEVIKGFTTKSFLEVKQVEQGKEENKTRRGIERKNAPEFTGSKADFPSLGSNSKSDQVQPKLPKFKRGSKNKNSKQNKNQRNSYNNQQSTASVDDLTRDSSEYQSTPNNQRKSSETYNVPDVESTLLELPDDKRIDKNNSCVNTTVSFFKGEPGHKITGGTTTILYLPEDDELHNILLIYYFLNHFIGEDFLCIPKAFIASTLNDAKYLSFCAFMIGDEEPDIPYMYIPYLRGLTPSLEEKRKLISKSPEVLLSDHRAFLGLERECVVTIVNQNDSKMLHKFVEIVSRCSTSLYIIVLSGSEEVQPNTLGVVLKKWEEKRLVFPFRVHNDDQLNSDVKFDGTNMLVNKKNEDFKEKKSNFDKKMSKCFEDFGLRYQPMSSGEEKK